MSKITKNLEKEPPQDMLYFAQMLSSFAGPMAAEEPEQMRDQMGAILEG